MATVCRLDFQGQLIPMVNWKLNAYKQELAKTDSPPSPEASKISFHEHPESFPTLVQIPFSVYLARWRNICVLF